MTTESEIRVGNLLIVGEASDDLAELMALLTECGYQVSMTAASVFLGDVLRSAQPNLVLLAIATASDSYQLCQALTSSPEMESIFVLMVASSAAAVDIARAFQYGAADYVSYPFHRGELLARIERVLTIGQLKHQLKEKSRLLEQVANVLGKVDEGAISAASLRKLTETANRQLFEDYLTQEWRRCARERVLWGDSPYTHFSLVACWLDRADIYREQLGLKVQQDFLQKVSTAISAVLKRPADYVTRYDGDRFAILLPNTDETGALQVIKLIQSAIRQLDFSERTPDPVTLSFGLETGIPSHALPADLLLQSALKALDRAIREGGDRVVSDRF